MNHRHWKKVSIKHDYHQFFFRFFDVFVLCVWMNAKKIKRPLFFSGIIFFPPSWFKHHVYHITELCVFVLVWKCKTATNKKKTLINLVFICVCPDFIFFSDFIDISSKSAYKVFGYMCVWFIHIHDMMLMIMMMMMISSSPYIQFYSIRSMTRNWISSPLIIIILWIFWLPHYWTGTKI